MLPRQFLSDPTTWGESDLQRLVSEQVPEGQRVEYKSSLILESKKQKAEVAKDISGMANAQGGWIFFGISEGEGPEPLPVAVTALPSTGLQTRLENILDSALEPIPEYQIATIRIDDGVAIIAKVARAAGLPVMVQGYEQSRYFIRSGTRTRPMNASEVAQAHSAAQNRAEAVVERLKDLPLIAAIAPGLRELSIATMEAVPVVCLVVAAMDGPEELIKRSRIQADAFQEQLEGYRNRRPVRAEQPWTINSYGLMQEARVSPPAPEKLGTLMYSPRVNEDDDRLKVYRLGIYRTGVVEWARRYPRGQTLPSASVADDVHNALLFSARVFDEVAYAGRLKVWLRLEHASDAIIELPATWDVSARSPGVDVLPFSCEVTTDQLLSDPSPTVQAAMDAIWQGFGIDRCLHFDADGNWLI
jgi:hypothetical protein